jgi:hypothetical protein
MKMHVKYGLFSGCPGRTDQVHTLRIRHRLNGVSDPDDRAN